MEGDPPESLGKAAAPIIIPALLYDRLHRCSKGGAPSLVRRRRKVMGVR